MLDYKLIEALAMVTAEGGFEKAAQSLLITQSAVSQRIKALEELTGAGTRDAEHQLARVESFGQARCRPRVEAREGLVEQNGVGIVHQTAGARCARQASSGAS